MTDIDVIVIRAKAKARDGASGYHSVWLPEAEEKVARYAERLNATHKDMEYTVERTRAQRMGMDSYGQIQVRFPDSNGTLCVDA